MCNYLYLTLLLVLVSKFLIPDFIGFMLFFSFDTLYFLSLYYVTVKHLGQHLMLFKGAI